jgi:hypothetical protein
MPKIEIDLADLGLPTGQDRDGEPTGSQSLQDLIVNEAARRLIGNDRELQQELRSKITKQFDDEISTRVVALVEDAFIMPIQRTTPWGEEKGEPTTVKEMIREHIEKFLTGTGRRRDSYNRDPQDLADVIDEAVKAAMTTDLQKNVDEAKKQVHTKITEAALKAAVEILNK